TARTTARGNRGNAAAATLYTAPGTEITLPRRRSRSAPCTNASASSHIHEGRLDMFIRARSWNSVRVYPGARSMTWTPVPATWAASPSVNAVTHALAALYVPRGTQPATEPTLITAP